MIKKRYHPGAINEPCTTGSCMDGTAAYAVWESAGTTEKVRRKDSPTGHIQNNGKLGFINNVSATGFLINDIIDP